MVSVLKEREEEKLFQGVVDPQIQAIGDLGEDITSEILKTYLSDDYSLINDLFVRTKEHDLTQLDHVLIHESFIICIETKNYSGSARALDAETWELAGTQKSYTMNSPQLQSHTHAMHVNSFLAEHTINIPVFSVVILVSERCKFDGSSDTFFNNRCPVMYGKEIISYIKCLEQVTQDSQKHSKKGIADLLLSENEGIKNSTLYQCKKAALHSNDPKALFELGRMYVQGYFQYRNEPAIRVKKDQKAGRNYLWKAANQGYQPAKDFLRNLKQ